MELKKYFSKFLVPKSKSNPDREDALYLAINRMTGIRVRNIELYREAFSLKSASREHKSQNYERLEFLGDSVLGSIISCYLFSSYNEANEGFLTQMKSKIVNRKNLNLLGEDLGLTHLLQNEPQVILSENIAGNLFEAFIGALYLDLGYEVCRKVVLERLLTPTDINKLENKIVSYKGLLLEWSQKQKIKLKYQTQEEEQGNRQMVFRAVVWLDDHKIANATDTSKKKAEEKAAQRAFYILNKKECIIENKKTSLRC